MRGDVEEEGVSTWVVGMMKRVLESLKVALGYYISVITLKTS